MKKNIDQIFIKKIFIINHHDQIKIEYVETPYKKA